jgi:hypothetical protein
VDLVQPLANAGMLEYRTLPWSAGNPWALGSLPAGTKGRTNSGIPDARVLVYAVGRWVVGGQGAEEAGGFDLLRLVGSSRPIRRAGSEAMLGLASVLHGRGVEGGLGIGI